MEGPETYPRELTPWEKELLLWLLPEERAGYREYRIQVEHWKVVSGGRRGEGNFILAPPDERIDVESPLPQVLALGAIVTKEGDISVTIRERLGNQIEFEIAKLGVGELHGRVEEIRRWTLSTWKPGLSCPACEGAVREVPLATTHGHRLTLAVCRKDEKLWIHDGRTEINHPIPPTNFYNELMLRKRIRDPQIVLHPTRLFLDLDSYTDAELAAAFRSYNQIRTKIPLAEEIVLPAGPRRRSLFTRLTSFFRKESS